MGATNAVTLLSGKKPRRGAGSLDLQAALRRPQLTRRNGKAAKATRLIGRIARSINHIPTLVSTSAARRLGNINHPPAIAPGRARLHNPQFSEVCREER